MSRIMTVYRVIWRQATKSKKCYFKRASTAYNNRKIFIDNDLGYGEIDIR